MKIEEEFWKISGVKRHGKCFKLITIKIHDNCVEKIEINKKIFGKGQT